MPFSMESMNKYLPNFPERSMEGCNVDFPVASPVSIPQTKDREPFFKNYHGHGEKTKDYSIKTIVDVTKNAKDIPQFCL